MRRALIGSWGVLVWLACSSGVQTQTLAVDWDKQKAEILQHYRALVQINTSSPPGNETKVVDYLKKVLEAEGIPTRTFALDPNRANLVARLKGNGTKRPMSRRSCGRAAMPRPARSPCGLPDLRPPETTGERILLE